MLMFTYMQKNLEVKTAGGNFQGWRIDGVKWRRWNAQGDMREETNFKDADRELPSVWSVFCTWLCIKKIIFFKYLFFWRN